MQPLSKFQRHSSQNEKKILKFICKLKRLLISKPTLNRKNNAGCLIAPQTILQSHSNQNSMVLAQKQTNKMKSRS